MEILLLKATIILAATLMTASGHRRSGSSTVSYGRYLRYGIDTAHSSFGRTNSRVGDGYVGSRFPYRGRARSSARRMSRSRRAAMDEP